MSLSRQILVTPPTKNPTTSTSFSRKTYTCPAFATIRVNEYDAGVLSANGWTWVTSPTQGPSDTRPVLVVGEQGWRHFDTTLGKWLIWLGTTWADLITGAAVASVPPRDGLMSQPVPAAS